MGLKDDTYKDIINKERPVHINDDFSIKHPKMSKGDRAKIFAPFAALKRGQGEEKKDE